MLWVKIDYKLHFDEHVKTLCSKTNKKLRALARANPYVSVATVSLKQSHYNLRRCNDFRIPSIRTVYHGSESISFLGPKIWNILSDEIKHQTSLNSFKK